MSLADRISAFFARKQTAAPVDTLTERPVPQQPMAYAHHLRAENDRRSIIHACNAMYEEDPRCEGAIDALARDVVKGGFSIRSQQTPRAVEVFTALDERIHLQSRLDDFLRETFIDGDSLLEVGVSGDDTITSVTRKSTLMVHRNSDRADMFSDPLKAFWMTDDVGSWFTVEPPLNALWFAEWQIVHARWKHRTQRRYGRPLFASALSAYKRVSEGEMDISVRRKTRAGMKYLHVVEGADMSALMEYQRINQAALDDPWAAVSDFFTNKGSITAIQGDARLNDIDDIVHHIETWWTASPIPMVLVGYGKDLNRDVLEQKLEQYERALEQLTAWVEEEFIIPLLEREWLLNGIYPPSLKYDIVWRYKAPTRASDIKDIADAILRFKALGIPNEIVWSIIERFLPWLNISTLLDQTAPEPASAMDVQPDRLAQNMAGQAGTSPAGPAQAGTNG